jgi:acetyl-CoA acetyltransferase
MDNLKDKLGIQMRRYGLQARCIGHGMATATITEAVDI